MNEKEKARVRAHVYYAENKARVLSRARAYYAANPELMKTRSSAYYAANKGKAAKTNAAYRSANREAVLNAKRVWYEANKEEFLKGAAQYKRLNPGKVNALKAKRKARQLQATPVWADLAEIKEVYLEGAYMNMAVDHIIPLQSKLVCGLHVWNNLQLLTGRENSKKHNKFDQSFQVTP